MSDSRFEKFVSQTTPEKNPNEFAEEYKLIIQQMEKDKIYAESFEKLNALGHPTRWAIYNLLKIQPMCTCALAKVFQMKENAISHHLKILEGANLIVGKKEGYFTLYRVKQMHFSF